MEAHGRTVVSLESWWRFVVKKMVMVSSEATVAIFGIAEIERDRCVRPSVGRGERGSVSVLITLTVLFGEKR
jgi:hypothetical protein